MSMSERDVMAGDLDAQLAWWWQRLPHIEPYAASLVEELLRDVGRCRRTPPPTAEQGKGEWVLVPREPTVEMVTAALGHLYAHFAKDGQRPFGQFVPGCTAAESEDMSQQWYGPDRLRNAYAAMLAAAPASDAGQGVRS
jgi:hypothetical protein